MRVHRFSTEQWLARPLTEVFGFFADAVNLQQLTPPWLDFRILTPLPIPMHRGTHVDYRLRVHGVPIRWRSEIEIWEPPHRFVDVQVRGPYRLWRHEHVFRERAGRTRVRDDIRYAVWGGSLVDRLLVRRDVERIFAYRKAELERRFGTAAA